MPFQVSPGVNVSEIDLTTVVPAVATTEGGLVGEFRWGPAGTRVLLDSEDRLVNIFQKPNTTTAEDFFTASNFLSYGNALYVVRETGTGAKNSAEASADAALFGQGADTNGWSNTPTGDSNFFGKYPGELGNSLRVSVCRDSVDYSSSTSVFEYTIDRNSANLNLLNTSVATVAAQLSVGDIIELGAEKQRIKIKSIATATSDLDDDAASDDVLVTLESKYKGEDVSNIGTGEGGSAVAIVRHWEFSDVFDNPPATSAYAEANGSVNDEIHVVVVDAGGQFSGTAGSILEAYAGLSLASDAKTEQGAGNFWFNVINTQSQYLAAVNRAIFANAGKTTAESVTSPFGSSGDATISPLARGVTLAGGLDGTALTAAQKIAGYDLFKNAEDVDVSFLLGGNADQTLALKLIDIAESRKDCLAVLSPEKTDVVNAGINTRDNVIAFRDSLPSTSYAVMDSGWKYQYDKYNDVYRWVPLNADTAGLMVQTDLTRDPWYSPAGYNRGNMKNVVKLAYNPGKGDRDQLYKKGVNPVITQPGQGTVLFGDKTLLSKPSAFDRINVRRLFIVLEKAIATAAKFTLFEFNDEFTRSQFTNLVVPFLRDVQGRRGITDFQVVCDGSNNTGEVIDRNEFIGDIYIKPARSINFIQLNFVAVRSGVEFSEVVGRV